VIGRRRVFGFFTELCERWEGCWVEGYFEGEDL